MSHLNHQSNLSFPLTRTAIGQDSHPFASAAEERPLILAGCVLENEPGLSGDSDADVIFHAITNAISGISGENILGPPADRMCKGGITDSRAYLDVALKGLTNHPARPRPYHVSVSLEAKRPRLWAHMPRLCESIANALDLPLTSVGLTATTGDGLTNVGRGEGIACLVVLTCVDTIRAE